MNLKTRLLSARESIRRAIQSEHDLAKRAPSRNPPRIDEQTEAEATAPGSGPQSLQSVARSLILYRADRGCAAEVIVRMALKIGYDAGAEDGYQTGYTNGVNAWTDTEAMEDATTVQLEPVAEEVAA
jgi:hypothetical protein